jgi:hypothetical protein
MMDPARSTEEGQMGARPEQQLALNFLAAVQKLWLEHPATHSVQESADGFVPALAQMCIKSLSADLRDGLSRHQREELVTGFLDNGKDKNNMLSLGDVFDKIIHGTPVSVTVRDGQVWLRFRNNKISTDYPWVHAEFSGTEVLERLEKLLHKHHGAKVAARERAIKDFLEKWRPEDSPFGPPKEDARGLRSH